jgi:hypothetical protein
LVHITNKPDNFKTNFFTHALYYSTVMNGGVA